MHQQFHKVINFALLAGFFLITSNSFAEHYLAQPATVCEHWGSTDHFPRIDSSGWKNGDNDYIEFLTCPLASSSAGANITNINRIEFNVYDGSNDYSVQAAICTQSPSSSWGLCSPYARTGSSSYNYYATLTPDTAYFFGAPFYSFAIIILPDEDVSQSKLLGYTYYW